MIITTPQQQHHDMWPAGIVIGIMAFILLIMLCGMVWRLQQPVVEEAFEAATTVPSSLSTNIAHPNAKCQYGTLPTVPYKPRVAVGLIVDQTVDVYDNATHTWRRAVVTTVADSTISAAYIDASTHVRAETLVPFSRVRRLSSANEIETCAKVCGMKGTISVGDCVVDNACQCMCVQEPHSCTPSTADTWNTYHIDPETVDLQATAKKFHVPITFADEAAAAAPTPPPSVAPYSPTGQVCDDGQGAECRSYCDKLPTAKQRELCKNPAELLRLSAFIPARQTLKTDAMCKYNMKPAMRHALQCPPTDDAPKPCWQYPTSPTCTKQAKCVWNSMSNMCQNDGMVQQRKCTARPNIDVFHKSVNADIPSVVPLFQMQEPGLEAVAHDTTTTGVFAL